VIFQSPLTYSTNLYRPISTDHRKRDLTIDTHTTVAPIRVMIILACRLNVDQPNSSITESLFTIKSQVVMSIEENIRIPPLHTEPVPTQSSALSPISHLAGELLTVYNPSWVYAGISATHTDSSSPGPDHP